MTPIHIPLPPELCSEINLAYARQLQRDANTYRTIAQILEGARFIPSAGYKCGLSMQRVNQRIMAQAGQLRAKADRIEEKAYQQEDIGWAFYIKT